MSHQRLLISVRGPCEAVIAAKGGAHIADVEYPASALGTPYPLNIKAVRDRLDRERFTNIPISTNIGEEQSVRSTACQAALGVALAGADYVKCGLAELEPKAAEYLAKNLVRTVREWFPKKRIYPAVFCDPELVQFFDPLTSGRQLVEKTESDGLLIDTFNKQRGKGLLDYYSIEQIAQFVEQLHAIEKEAWIAGSIFKAQLRRLWQTGVDVICVRGAACASTTDGDRFGEVSEGIVADLSSTIPAG
jgi:(5-formylfuran-3-yl)methyl phosphate synthase